MKDFNVVIEPFQLISILECTIHKQANEHFSADVVGYISPENADEIIMRCSPTEKLAITAKGEDGAANVLFKGVINSLSVKSENGLKKLTIHALSFTSLLDQREWVRTFQNERQTYKAVANFIESKYPDAVFIYTSGAESTNGMVVQYQESDWEFLKRMAGRLHTVVIPDSKNDNICLCFGIPRKSQEQTIEPIMYSVVKNIDEYSRKKKQRVSNFSEQDSIDYIVTSREIFELCEPVKFMGQTLLVYEMTSRLEGSELIHTYRLRSGNGFRSISSRNEKIIGTSITGRIVDVRRDEVQVHMDSDDDCPDGVEKWFQYSTVYSSPEGAGWYCMPERNDKIRVYFPDAEENNAYVISAVHLGAVDQMRKNPDEKSIRTIHDKEIRLTPTKILITNHKGMSITLDDSRGISIVSSKAISMSSGESVNITSGGELMMSGEQGVFLQQNQNVLMVRNGIREYGLNIEHR